MFVVVIVEKPLDQATRVSAGWPKFAEDVDDIAGRRGSKSRPSENVWLLELPKDTARLSSLVSAVEGRPLALRVLYFQEAPKEFSQPSSLKDEDP